MEWYALIDKLSKKYILAGNILNARKYVISEAYNGNPSYNYQEHNTTSLISTLIGDDKRMVSNKESAFIIYNLIKNNYDKYVKGKYLDIYKRDTFTIKAVSKLLEVINDYRLSLSNKSDELFDIEYESLINDYKKYLDKNNLIDYIFALDLIRDKKDNTKLLVLDDLDLSPKEEEIFKNVFTSIEYVHPTKGKSNIIDSYPCYGIYNEILNVLDVIKKNNYPINDCEILYTSSSYENLLRATLDSFNIKYSITGAHAKALNIISFMLDVLDYIKNDYQYEALEGILTNSGLENIYLHEFYKTLDTRKTNFTVGYGYNRTKKLVDKLEGEAKVINIRSFLSDLLACNDYYNFDFKAFRLFTYKYLNNGKELLSIKNKIDNLEYIINLADNKVDTLIEELSSLKYTENVSNTLQLSMLSKTFSLKKYLFIIGLSQSYVVGADTENPFILDINKYKEILGNHKYLHILDNLKYINTDALDYYINYSNSNIYLSYSYFDKIEFKPSSPSIYYLNKHGNVFDEKKNNGVNLYDIDKSNIIFGDAKIEGSDVEFDHNYDNGEIDELIDSVPHLDNEGEVVVRKNYYDDHDYHLSPSALQVLIACPYWYYYDKICHLPNPSYPSLDVSGWLDPNAKGTFFHEVLELYGKKTGFKGKLDKDIFDEVFDEALNNAKALNPIKNRDIAEVDIKAVRRSALRKAREIISDYQENNYSLIGCEYDLSLTGYKYKNIAFNGSIDRVDGRVVGDTLHVRVVDYKTGSYKKKEDSHYLQHVIYSKCVENSATKFEGFKYDKVVVDEFIYDYVFANKINRYDRVEIEDESNKTFDKVDKILTNYIKNNKCYIDFDTYFDEEREEAGKNQKTICGYCNYKKLCIKRLEKGVEFK